MPHLVLADGTILLPVEGNNLLIVITDNFSLLGWFLIFILIMLSAKNGLTGIKTGVFSGLLGLSDVLSCSEPLPT